MRVMSKESNDESEKPQRTGNFNNSRTGILSFFFKATQ